MHEETLRLFKAAQGTPPVVHGFENTYGIRIRSDLVLYELEFINLPLELHQKISVIRRLAFLLFNKLFPEEVLRFREAPLGVGIGVATEMLIAINDKLMEELAVGTQRVQLVVAAIFEVTLLQCVQFALKLMVAYFLQL